MAGQETYQEARACRWRWPNYQGLLSSLSSGCKLKGGGRVAGVEELAAATTELLLKPLRGARHEHCLASTMTRPFSDNTIFLRGRLSLDNTRPEL